MPRKMDVELKGGMYTFMSLKLYTGDIDIIDQRVADKVQQAPGFFKDTPVVVDLTDLDVSDISVDMDALMARLRNHHLVPIVASVVNKSGAIAAQSSLPLIEGVARQASKAAGNTDEAKDPKPVSDSNTGVSTEGGDEEASGTKDHSEISLTNTGRSDENNAPSDEGGESSASDATGVDEDAAEQVQLEPMSAQEVQYIVKKPQLMARPVRSGQQVYARDTDLIVMGQVGPGAEVIADNHIHVYGPLRGRALCGVTGNTEARIFCQSLEAELVSVAGNYRVLESIPEDLRGKPAQIWLDDERLNIEPL